MEKEWTIEEFEREVKKLIEKFHGEVKYCSGNPFLLSLRGANDEAISYLCHCEKSFGRRTTWQSQRVAFP